MDELVAPARSGVAVGVVRVRAAEAGDGEGEGGVVLLPVAGGRRILNGVPVRVPADGVQLVETVYLYQPVIVPVVIPPLEDVIHAAEFQDGVFAVVSEMPRVVVARRAVHVHVPVFVDAGVADGVLQDVGRHAFGRGVAGVVGDAACGQVPIGVGDCPA